MKKQEITGNSRELPEGAILIIDEFNEFIEARFGRDSLRRMRIAMARLQDMGKVYISKGGTHWHWPGCPIVEPPLDHPSFETAFRIVAEAIHYDYYMIDEKDLPAARTHNGRRFLPCPMCSDEARRRR